MRNTIKCALAMLGDWYMILIGLALVHLINPLFFSSNNANYAVPALFSLPFMSITIIAIVALISFNNMVQSAVQFGRSRINAFKLTVKTCYVGWLVIATIEIALIMLKIAIYSLAGISFELPTLANWPVLVLIFTIALFVFALLSILNITTARFKLFIIVWFSALWSVGMVFGFMLSRDHNFFDLLSPLWQNNPSYALALSAILLALTPVLLYCSWLLVKRRSFDKY